MGMIGKKFKDARESIRTMNRNEVAALLPRLGTLQDIPSDFFVPPLCLTFGDMWSIQSDYHNLRFVLLVGERNGQTLGTEKVLVFTADTWLNALAEREADRLVPTTRWPEGSYGASIVAAANDEMRGLLDELDAEGGDAC
jgi:hypothetical protein